MVAVHRHRPALVGTSVSVRELDVVGTIPSG